VEGADAPLTSSAGRRASDSARSSRACAWPTAWSIRATFSSSSVSAEAFFSISCSRASLAPLNASNAAIISCMAARASGVPEACLVSFMVSPLEKSGG